MSNNAYIVSAVRTAGGKKNGSLSQWHPADLGAKVLNELVHQTSIDPELIDDVVFGCVDQVGAQSGNVARNAILASTLYSVVGLRHKVRARQIHEDLPVLSD